MATKIDPNDAGSLIRAERVVSPSFAMRRRKVTPNARLIRSQIGRSVAAARPGAVSSRSDEACAGRVQRSLHYAPRSREALLQLSAELYRKLDEPHRALVSLQALADTYSPGEEPQQLFIEEGLAYATLRRHADAAQALRQALRRGPPTTDLLLLTCEAESAAGDATAAFRAAQQRWPWRRMILAVANFCSGRRQRCPPPARPCGANGRRAFVATMPIVPTGRSMHRACG